MRHLVSFALALGLTAAMGANAQVIINEIDVDQTGTDTSEFVELFDGGSGNTSLQGVWLVLFNGSADASYYSLDLSLFTTDSDGFLVVGNVIGADVLPGVASSWLQNGADAAALYTAPPGAAWAPGRPAGAVVLGQSGATFILSDALVYDTNDPQDDGLLTALGESEQFNEDENGSRLTESLQWGDGAWMAGAPTPGGPNFNAAVGIPATSPINVAVLAILLLVAAAVLSGSTTRQNR